MCTYKGAHFIVDCLKASASLVCYNMMSTYSVSLLQDGPRYEVGGQKRSALDQTFADFFEPELAKWLLTEMEQNRNRTIAASKVISVSWNQHHICIDWHSFYLVP